jgi:hypothetical protein
MQIEVRPEPNFRSDFFLGRSQQKKIFFRSVMTGGQSSFCDSYSSEKMSRFERDEVDDRIDHKKDSQKRMVTVTSGRMDFM